MWPWDTCHIEQCFVLHICMLQRYKCALWLTNTARSEMLSCAPLLWQEFVRTQENRLPLFVSWRTKDLKFFQHDISTPLDLSSSWVHISRDRIATDCPIHSTLTWYFIWRQWVELARVYWEEASEDYMPTAFLPKSAWPDKSSLSFCKLISKFWN